MYDFNDPLVLTNISNWDKTESAQHQQNRKQVVLTFDDGPGRHTNQILSILEKEDAHAVFFWLSNRLYPQRPWERLLSNGHQLGSHGRNHRNLQVLDYAEQYREINLSQLKIEQIIEQSVIFFRPPYGQYNSNTLLVLKELHLTPVLWEVSSMDWELKENPDKIIENVVNHVKDGSIILLHELEQTVKVLEELVQELKHKGFSFQLLPN